MVEERSYKREAVYVMTAEPLLYTTRHYPCGCKAEGPGDVPAYCQEHSEEDPALDRDAWRLAAEALQRQLDEVIKLLRAGAPALALAEAEGPPPLEPADE